MAPDNGGDVDFSPAGFEQLPGWQDDDHHEALLTFSRTLEVFARMGRQRWPNIPDLAWQELSQAAETARRAGESKWFFQDWFVPKRVGMNGSQSGLFTGYFEPELRGSRIPDRAFPVPVYERPDDLVEFAPEEEDRLGVSAGKKGSAGLLPYDTRQEIEQGSLKDRARVICWLDSWINAFFLHVQGSGRVRFADGTTIRLGFSAKSGWPYTSIGAILLERGACRKEEMSMPFLRQWMAKDDQRGRQLMWQNRSYIFFRVLDLPDPTLGALGAAGAQLSPGRSIAMDPTHWPFGLPVWLETPLAEFQGSELRRLMVMQDKGSAIKGPLRGDIYWGWGADAERLAGNMKSKGRLTALLPRFLPHVMNDSQ